MIIITHNFVTITIIVLLLSLLLLLVVVVVVVVLLFLLRQVFPVAGDATWQLEGGLVRVIVLIDSNANKSTSISTQLDIIRVLVRTTNKTHISRNTDNRTSINKQY